MRGVLGMLWGLRGPFLPWPLSDTGPLGRGPQPLGTTEPSPPQPCLRQHGVWREQRAWGVMVECYTATHPQPQPQHRRGHKRQRHRGHTKQATWRLLSGLFHDLILKGPLLYDRGGHACDEWVRRERRGREVVCLVWSGCTRRHTSKTVMIVCVVCHPSIPLLSST
jgi:hypothetical protein